MASNIPLLDLGGSVTSVGTSGGLTGGPIITTGTLSIADTAVTPGSYTLAGLTVDQKGRLTAASSGSAVTSVATGTGLTGGPITGTGTVSLANTAVTPASYTLTNLTVDQQGRLTAASNGSAVTSVTAGTGLSGGVITSTGTISMPNVGPGAGNQTVNYSTGLNLDAQGRVVSLLSGSFGTDFDGSPTFSSATNITIASGHKRQLMEIQNYVIAVGRFDFTTTATGATVGSVNMDLPAQYQPTNNFSTTFDAGGSVSFRTNAGLSTTDCMLGAVCFSNTSAKTIAFRLEFNASASRTWNAGYVFAFKKNN